MYRILIVEDDPSIAAALKEQISTWGMEARTVSDFLRVTDAFEAAQPHLVLMDITLPFFNGHHWCGEIRKTSRVPIIFLSSAADRMNMMLALNMGADDFVTKPFDMDLLMMKLRALLQRSYGEPLVSPAPSFRGAVLQPEELKLMIGSRAIDLTKNECRMLQCLMQAGTKVVSREKLMEALWKTDAFVDENTLTVNINRLRKKLDAAGLTNMIATRHGVGYALQEGDAPC